MNSASGRGRGQPIPSVSNNSQLGVMGQVENLRLNSKENSISLLHNLSSIEVSRLTEIQVKIWNIFMRSQAKPIVDKSIEEDETEIKTLIIYYFNDLPAPFWSLLKLLQFGHRFYLNKKQNFNPEENEEDPKIFYDKSLESIFNIFFDLKYPDSFLNDEVKMKSFEVLSQIEAEIGAVESANQIFKFDGERPQRYLRNIRQLVNKGNYKIAGQWVILLKLQYEFKITEILLPLILQDHLGLMMSYLDLETGLRQREFVDFCDNCCLSKRHFDEVVKKNNIKDIKIKTPRQLAKCMRRLSNRFEIPLEQLPNFKKWVQIFVVNRLIFSHYRDGEFDEEDWKNFLYEVVKGNFILQLEAIRLATNLFQDCGRVNTWVKEWKFPMKKLDLDIAKILRNGRDKPPIEIPLLVHDVDFYEPELPEIIWVGNQNDYKECLGYLTKSKVVGLDSEWKSNFGLNDTFSNNKTAIIQMATVDRIYLLDVIALKSKLQPDNWKLFVDLFENDLVLKLAFAFEDDWKNLSALCPTVFHAEDQYKTQSFIDLRELRDGVMAERHEVFPFYDPDKAVNRGLGNLVELCFEKTLNKREQISNWEKRPLRETQKHYAALDAYCLVSTYQLISRRCSELQVDLMKLIEQSQLLKPDLN